jgi:hypothetical protein
MLFGFMGSDGSLHEPHYRVCGRFFPEMSGWLWGLALPERRSSKGGKPGTDRTKGKKVKDEAMGTALRTVYHDAVSEPVPDEMLDLLRKLG